MVTGKDLWLLLFIKRLCLSCFMWCYLIALLGEQRSFFVLCCQIMESMNIRSGGSLSVSSV